MTEDDRPADPARSRGTLRRWAPLAIILVLTAVAFGTGWHRSLTLDSLVAHERALRAFIDSNLFGALAIYALVYVLVVALSLPGGLILTLAGGYLFGWFLGGGLTVLAATAGAILIFLVARSSLGESLAERAGPRLAALREGFAANALNYLLFLRLVPIFPFWLVNIAPALLGVSLKTYVVGTFIGIVPGTFAFAFVGAGLDGVVDAQRASFETCMADASARGLDPASACDLGLDVAALVTPGLLAALAALGVLALIPIAAKKVLRRRSAR
ncbi:TVP38/TMEM64 family protein [Microbaculum marinum]|uniref:TVP38/TMEM64 family membrane protein n=1 Tax=Microbaculum marinum TaxID=1764581 RepID=A0AAW9RTT7_9HYPH